MQRLRHTLDVSLPSVPLLTNLSVATAGVAAWLWPRAMLLRAELAMRQGLPDEARHWFTRFTTLWAGADPEFSDVVAHAHEQLRRLRQ